MDTFKAVEARKSVREYTGEPVNRISIEKLVEAGRRAPTARGVEPWEFIAVTTPEKLVTLGSMAPNGPFIAQCSCCIVIYCKDTKYYLEDGCAATENVLLMAADLGLGACWVAGDKKEYAGKVSELLKVPEEYKLISLISVGVPSKMEKQIKKRELKDVLHWDEFKGGK